MTEDPIQPSSGVTRRDALIGLGAVAGAAAVVSAVPFKASAGGFESILSQASAADLGPAIPGLTYVGIDAYEFWPVVASNRGYEANQGVRSNVSPDRLWAGLRLPVGSVIHQLNVGYQGQPIAEIHRRLITQPNPATDGVMVLQRTLIASPGGPFSSTENLGTPVTIGGDATYVLAFRVVGGSTVFGCTIGYLPPTQGFVPFTGTPRILDTRSGTKLGPGEERTVDLGIPGARTSVINLTITRTVGAGYVAVFPADIAWPGNSSINWSGPDQNIANGVITKVDSTGKIKIRGGDGSTDVIIDRIGYMV